jgi:hypothetical protein
MTKKRKNPKPDHLRVRKPKRESLSAEAREYVDNERNIAHIYKDGPYTFIQFFKGVDQVVTDSLKTLYSWLDKDYFFRPCKKAIVHFGAITALIPADNPTSIQVREKFYYTIAIKKREEFIDKKFIYEENQAK